MSTKTVDSYFSAVPAGRVGHIRTLHALIIDLFSEATVDMHYKMPTYRVGDGWVAIANQKHYVSLYTCSAVHLREFKEKHPEYKTGKACINFRERDILPIADIKEVVKHAMLHPKAS